MLRECYIRKGWKCQKGTREQQIGLKNKKKKKCVQEMLMESIQHLNDSMNSRLLKLAETLTNLVQAVNNLNQNVAVFNANVKTDFRSLRF